MQIVLIGIGGALGAITRYFISKYLFIESTFPSSTLIINLVGSLLLGFLIFSAFIKKHEIYLMITTGFLGAFTTFSTFSFELLHFLQQDQILLALLYTILSAVGGIGFAATGALIARRYIQA